MSDALKEAVLAALSKVSDPAKGTDIIAANMVQGLVVKGGAVGFALEVDPQRGAALEPLRIRPSIKDHRLIWAAPKRAINRSQLQPIPARLRELTGL